MKQKCWKLWGNFQTEVGREANEYQIESIFGKLFGFFVTSVDKVCISFYGAGSLWWIRYMNSVGFYLNQDKVIWCTRFWTAIRSKNPDHSLQIKISEPAISRKHVSNILGQCGTFLLSWKSRKITKTINMTGWWATHWRDRWSLYQPTIWQEMMRNLSSFNPLTFYFLG